MYPQMNWQTQEFIVQIIKTGDEQLSELVTIFRDTQTPVIDALKKWVKEGKASPQLYNQLSEADREQVEWERVVFLLHTVGFLAQEETPHV